MAQNYGKKFEAKFKEDFLKLDGATIDRLYDSMSGMYGVRNICDFIGYKYPNIYYLECKSHKGNTFPLSNLTQYDKLKEKVGIQGVRVGVVIWFIEKDKVVYVPISTVTELLNANKKSVNVQKIGEYNIKEIPSVKRRVFMDSDYSILTELEDGE